MQHPKRACRGLVGDSKKGGIKFESDAVVFRKRSQRLNDSAREYAFFYVLRSLYNN